MIMKKTFSLIAGLCCMMSCAGPDNDIPALIPVPSEAVFHGGYYTAGGASSPEDYCRLAEVCVDSVRYGSAGEEGYELVVTRKGIRINAATEAGAFYGKQTLMQLVSGRGVRCAVIHDSPRFPYRGIHLDVSRHFFPKEEVLKILDEMGRYKFNNFHFHLTDNGGWRIQIDRYPLLTELGAYRVMKDWDGWWEMDSRLFCRKDDPGAYGGFFTKEDIREIVAYAAERHINVIPEIEFPAHSDAVFVGYPHLNCTGTRYGNGEFCPANEQVYEFADNVLLEVMELFPSEVIHIGGDEARKHAWGKCPACTELMRREGMTDVSELQCYMISRLQKFLNSHGRIMAGWDQIIANDDLDSRSVSYTYRGQRGGIIAANRGIRTVMTPGEILYFDWYQADPKQEPKAMYGYSPIKKMYAFDPVPVTPESAAANESMVQGKYVSPDTSIFIRPEMAGYVIGVQGSTWAEYIPDEQHLEYMMFPRFLAVAEQAWSSPDRKDWQDFRYRMNVHRHLLEARGWNVYDLHNAPEIEITASGDRSIMEIEPENPEAEVRYTLDGSDPVAGSALYSSPVMLSGDAPVTVKAAPFIGGRRAGYIRELTVTPGESYRDYYPYMD